MAIVKAYDSAEIQKLVDKLRAVEVSGEYTGDASTYITDQDYREEIEDIINLADDVLITSGGKPNGITMQILAAEGFKVGPGEKDSFGWLTGVIHTSKGKIVFG